MLQGHINDYNRALNDWVVQKRGRSGMRRLAAFFIDLLMVALATVLAELLRDNLYYVPSKFAALLPYLLISLAISALIFPALGLQKAVWRYASAGDFARILVATVVVVSASVAALFSYNRLLDIARALPLLQGMLIFLLLVGVRVAARLQYSFQQHKSPEQLTTSVGGATSETVLVVGLSPLTDLYLRSVAEFAPSRIRIAGLLGRNDRQTGRFVHQHTILGTPEQLPDVLGKLEIHGVRVDRIVVAVQFNLLSERARTALLDVEKAESISVDFIAELLGLSGRAPELSRASEGRSAAFYMAPARLEAIGRRPYWRVKRALDFALAALLLMLLSPVMLAVALLVAIDVGFPVAFWQQRPGLAGHPFKLYKFRTMAPAHDETGRRVPDSERLSSIGAALRRMRLDELPQIFNILTGKMAFIGPRPLLPADQPSEYSARLLVRPGLTGWAQVGGGRSVSAADKAALDIWYVHNAGLLLDLRIIARTVHTVLFGERPNTAEINRAWLELRRDGICPDLDQSGVQQAA